MRFTDRSATLGIYIYIYMSTAAWPSGFDACPESLWSEVVGDGSRGGGGAEDERSGDVVIGA